MILVTGAAGKTGQAVIRALRGRDAAVRALVHRSEHEDVVRRAGALQVVHGDLRDPPAVGRATEGIEAVYHICPNVCPEEVDIGRLILEAARGAGVARFVFHSVLHPQTEAMPHHWRKLRVEELLLESGLDYTILQPAALMQNTLAHRRSIVDDGVLPVPYDVETRLSIVDLEDVAEVASRVLTQPGHAAATYELCGAEALSQTEVAAVLGEVLERPVRAVAIPLDAWREQAAAAGLDDARRDALVAMFAYYQRHGFLGNPNVLQYLLGREPTSFREFVTRAMRS